MPYEQKGNKDVLKMISALNPTLHDHELEPIYPIITFSYLIFTKITNRVPNFIIYTRPTEKREAVQPGPANPSATPREREVKKGGARRHKDVV